MAQQKQISDTTLALLAYWRAALAHSCLFHPAIPKDCEQIQIGQNDNGMWRVTEAPKDWIESTFSASKMNKAEDGDVRKPIPLLLIPALLVPESVHGIKRGGAESEGSLIPLCIPCMLTPEGTLLADTERLPWIPRQLLEPSHKDVTIGTLADFDQYLTQLTSEPETLSDTMKVAEDLFVQVTGCRLALLSNDAGDEAPALPLPDMEDYGLIDGWFGIPYEPSIIARHIIRLYDLLAEVKTANPLLESLAHMPDRRAQPPLPLAQSAPRLKKIVGHINRQYPLSPSQHEAMVELLGLKDGEILAVNGPPGTGKTTLLQSVVAQEWVMAAINGTACPIIAATSTNVKAVENVLDSFARLGHENAHERWLPDIGGFGIFLASASRDSEHPTYNGPDEHYFIRFETPDWVSRAKDHYLKQAKMLSQLDGKTETVGDVTTGLRRLLRGYHKYLQDVVTLRYQIFTAAGEDEKLGAITGMKQVIADCHRQIAAAEQEIAQAERIIEDCKARKAGEQAQHECSLQAIKKVELAWNTYLASLPSFMLDLFAFIPPVKRWRNARDRAFLLSDPLTCSLQHRDDEIEDHFTKLIRHEKLRTRDILADLQKTEHAATERRHEARTQKAHSTTRMHEAEALMKNWLVLLTDKFAEWVDVSLRDLNDKLDLYIRVPMFQFADWFWSGCWLIEMETRFREGSQDSKAPQKLETMLRRFAKLAPCMVSNFHMSPAYFCGWMGRDRPMPLWNVIDLLIVDEAGQVSPETGAPTFALAKRALVVGDVYQIEPIWNIPEGIDRANAAKFGLIEKWDDPRYLKMEQDGYTAAKGNLMQMSARACRLQKYQDIRGLFLLEHRRCVPELIDYCNKLVYGGRLDPVRKSIPPEKRTLPAFGYFAISSRDQKVGGSRKNMTEARAIVDWIVQNRTRLENHYLDPKTGQPQHISKIVAVVTPFNPQANLIASLIRKKMPDTKKKGCGITAGTVHRLQGAEREIVLFSSTYGEDHKQGMFFDKGRNMMNVAVSRAKDSFLVFGNVGLFNPQKSGSPSGLLAQYLFKHQENNLASATQAGESAAFTFI
jgi:hypothetical protein